MQDSNKEGITVYFGNDLPDGGDDSHWNSPIEQNKAMPTQHTSQIKQMLNTGFVFNLGRQGFSIATGRIGAYTGDYITQNKVNNAIAVAGLLSSIALSVATANPLPVISSGIGLATSAIDYEQSVRLANAKAGILSQITNTTVIGKGRGSGQRL